MVNFADCVSKVQCRNLVTNTPTKDGIRALLKATTSVNKTSQNGFKLGGVPTLVQDSVMFSMGAKEKSQKWLQKFIKKGLLPNDKPFATEILDSKFEPCGIPVGTKEMFNSNIAKALEVPVDTFVKAIKN